MNNSYYMQVIPNSHFWTRIEGVLFSLKSKDIYDNGVLINDTEYILTGIKNAISHGYKIKKTEEKKVNDLPYFNNINEIIYYIESIAYDKDIFITMLENTKNNGFDFDNGIKIERKEVYKMIDGERNYQDMRWNINLSDNDIPDEEKPIAEWLNYIEYHLGKAKERIYHLNKNDALAELRKIAALAVRAMEIHGCPERQINPEIQL